MFRDIFLSTYVYIELVCVCVCVIIQQAYCKNVWRYQFAQLVCTQGTAQAFFAARNSITISPQVVVAALNQGRQMSLVPADATSGVLLTSRAWWKVSTKPTWALVHG